MVESPFPQLSLFDIADTLPSTAELFPAVWQAIEGLAAPEPPRRYESLERLISLKAARVSPLAAYMLATRLIDPDITFRIRVIQALGEMVAARGEDKPTEEVRRYLRARCMVMGRGTVLAVLEAVIADDSIEPHATALFTLCSHAGNILVDLACDRKVGVNLRDRAIRLLGKIGFIEAIGRLERLADWLAKRAGEQRRMPFAPPALQEEADLLPLVQSTLTLLRQP